MLSAVYTRPMANWRWLRDDGRLHMAKVCSMDNRMLLPERKPQEKNSLSPQSTHIAVYGQCTTVCVSSMVYAHTHDSSYTSSSFYSMYAVCSCTAIIVHCTLQLFWLYPTYGCIAHSSRGQRCEARCRSQHAPVSLLTCHSQFDRS